MIPKQYLELLKNRKECSNCNPNLKEDVFNQWNKVIKYHSFGKNDCKICSGTGFEPLTLLFPEKVLRCKGCDNGSVYIKQDDGSSYGIHCEDCKGSGLIWKEGEEYEFEIGKMLPRSYPSASAHFEKVKFKILSLKRKRLDEIDGTLIEACNLLEMFGELKDDEEMILVKV